MWSAGEAVPQPTPPRAQGGTVLGSQSSHPAGTGEPGGPQSPLLPGTAKSGPPRMTTRARGFVRGGIASSSSESAAGGGSLVAALGVLGLRAARGAPPSEEELEWPEAESSEEDSGGHGGE